MMVMLVLITGCSGKTQNSEFEKSKGKTIIFNKKLVKVIGMSAEELKEDLEKNGTENYEEIVAHEDSTVSITVTEEQTSYWLESREKLLKEMQDSFAELGESFKMEYDTGFATINYTFSPDLDVQTAASYVINGEVYCAMHQLFSHGEGEEWKVFINIYNSQTGKLVTSGDSETGISWTKEDWDKSEQ